MIGKQDIVRMWKEQSLITDKAVMNAFLSISREHFVPKQFTPHAYEDSPLPIICGKTISQPTTIALMTQALELKPGQTVLEIGAGSGYQAALLGHIVGPKGKIISTEVVPELVQFAKENIKKTNLKNICIVEEDGSQGFPAKAPFDRIIITAACPHHIPQTLLDQLKPEGILVGPVGDLHLQEVVKIKKLSNGLLKTSSLGEFRFLPLIGKHGFKDEEVD